MRKLIVWLLLIVIAAASGVLCYQVSELLEPLPVVATVTTTPAPAPADPVAPFDIRPSIGLIGRFSAAHGCPVGPTAVLTNAHVNDPEPFSDAPLLPYRAWSAVEGDINLLSAGVSYAADLAIMKPEDGRRLTFYFPIAASAPAIGDLVYWTGFDWRTRQNMFAERVFSGKVVRVAAGSIVVAGETTTGSSGSCMLDSQGRVVGVVAWGMRSDEAKDDAVTVAVGVFGAWFTAPEPEPVQ